MLIVLLNQPCPGERSPAHQIVPLVPEGHRAPTQDDHAECQGNNEHAARCHDDCGCRQCDVQVALVRISLHRSLSSTKLSMGKIAIIITAIAHWADIVNLDGDGARGRSLLSVISTRQVTDSCGGFCFTRAPFFNTSDLSRHSMAPSVVERTEGVFGRCQIWPEDHR